MKQLVNLVAAVCRANMENTPLCYIVPNCNTDGRRDGDGGRTAGKSGVFSNMGELCAVRTYHATEHPDYIGEKRLNKKFTKKSRKIVLTNRRDGAIIYNVNTPTGAHDNILSGYPCRRPKRTAGALPA